MTTTESPHAADSANDEDGNSDESDGEAPQMHSLLSQKSFHPVGTGSASHTTRVGKKVAQGENVVELAYEDINFDGFDAKVGEDELRTGICAMGADDTDLVELKIHFNAGPLLAYSEGTVAQMIGPLALLVHLQSLPLATLKMNGQMPSEVKVGRNVRKMAQDTGCLTPYNRRPYKVGDRIEVFSNSYGVWGQGVVYRVRDGFVTAEFELPGGGLARKDLPASHSDLRPATTSAPGESLVAPARIQDLQSTTASTSGAQSWKASRDYAVIERRRRRRQERVEEDKKVSEFLGGEKEERSRSLRVAAREDSDGDGQQNGSSLSLGQLVWHPAASAGIYRPCRVQPNKFEGRRLITAQGREVQIDDDDRDVVVPGDAYPNSLAELDLQSLDTLKLEHTLRTRFCNGESFTRVGDMLAYINPFGNVGGADGYRTYADEDVIVENVLECVTKYDKDQAIFFVGEPCSGKSTVMQNVLDRLLQKAKCDKALGKRILMLRALLHPFLSIRCHTEDEGKAWQSTRAFVSVDLMFGEARHISGAKLGVHLLESSRVKAHDAEAMTFDAFYLAIKDKSSKQWTLRYEFRMLGLYADLDGYDPEDVQLNSWREALNYFGIPVQDVIRTLCGILLLSEIQQSIKQGESNRESQNVLTATARAFGINVQMLGEALSLPQGYSTLQASRAVKEVVEECYRRLVTTVVDSANRSLIDGVDQECRSRVSVLDVPAAAVGSDAAIGSDAVHLQWLVEAVGAGFLTGALNGREGVSIARRPTNSFHTRTACPSDVGWMTRAVLRALSWSKCKQVAELALPSTVCRRGDEYALQIAKGVGGMISGSGVILPWVVGCLCPNQQASPTFVSKPLLMRQIRTFRLLDVLNLAAREDLQIVWPLESFCNHYGRIIPFDRHPDDTLAYFAQRLIDVSCLSKRYPGPPVKSLPEAEALANSHGGIQGDDGHMRNVISFVDSKSSDEKPLQVDPKDSNSAEAERKQRQQVEKELQLARAEIEKLKAEAKEGKSQVTNTDGADLEELRLQAQDVLLAVVDDPAQESESAKKAFSPLSYGYSAEDDDEFRDEGEEAGKKKHEDEDPEARSLKWKTKWRKAVKKITQLTPSNPDLDHDPLPYDRRQAHGVVGTESVYLNNELQDILDFRLDQVTAVLDQVTANDVLAAPRKGAKRVSFQVEVQAQAEPERELPEPPKRTSLGGLAEGEQRVELLRRLRHGDLELVQLMEEQDRISKNFKRLHDEEHARYTDAKMERLVDSLTDMIDCHRVASEKDQEESQECIETRAHRKDLQRESEHWQKEAERLWWQVQALRSELDDRRMLYGGQ